MADNSRAINRIFTRKVICDLIQNGKNDVFDYVVRRYINEPEGKSHGKLVSEIYAHLGKQQRNEYYYMNTLLNKLLVGIHNVNTTTALSQIHIGHSIADFVMINGEGQVYEIKSGLDNFDRLYDQLHDYFCAFSKVSVLASIHELEKVKKILSTFGEIGNAVGIYVLSDQDTIFSRERSRNPLEYTELLDHTSIFKLLRKAEYENILRYYFGVLPQSAPVFYFADCLESFKRIPIEEAQRLTHQELKKRIKITIEEFENIQPELKSVVYFSNLIGKLPELNKLLHENYGR